MTSLCLLKDPRSTTTHRNKRYKFWSQLECTNKTTKRIIKPFMSGYARKRVYEERLSRELIPAVWYNLINRKRIVKQRDWFVGIKEVLIASKNPFTAFVSFMRSKTNSLVCIEIYLYLSQIENHTWVSRVKQVIIVMYLLRFSLDKGLPSCTACVLRENENSCGWFTDFSELWNIASLSILIVPLNAFGDWRQALPLTA